jgi:hypothetical protein
VIKVVQTEGKHEPYCALSYRWPPSAEVRLCLTTNNAHMLSMGCSSDKLPGAIQDVCTIAKCLGIRFAWVDALVSPLATILPHPLLPVEYS